MSSFRSNLKIFSAVVFPLMQLIVNCSTVMADNGNGPTWREWDDNVFSQAASEKKLVLLNLEAVWCHWCHVMAQQTYSDPEIQKQLEDHFILVKVDQDSRPDLSNRYRDYGWPATIILNSKGIDLAKRAGFIEPSEMKALLNQVVENPDKPEKEGENGDSGTLSSSPAGGLLTEALRSKLVEKYFSSFDESVGGLKTSHKYVDPDTADFSLIKAARGGDREAQMIKLTLDNNLQLLDPIWGGYYQYSTGGRWDRPHYEKIISTQAANLRIYSVAGVLFDQPKYKDASKLLYKYLKTFLVSPEGVFYTSQDADVVRGEKAVEYFSLDDKARRARGIPVVDTHIYSRENGWMVASLARFGALLSIPEAVEDAKVTAIWIQKNRALADGGFRHGESDSGGPFLGDTLAMGQGCLALYETTADRRWYDCAEGAFNFIEKNFSGAPLGYFTAVRSKNSVLTPVVELSEQIALARAANQMYAYSGNSVHKKISESAMSFLSRDKIALDSITEAGILAADLEMREAPLHIAVVGSKNDPVAKELFSSALKIPVLHRRVEWIDAAEPPLPNPDVKYPQLPRSAAFVCTGKRCSMPIFEPAQVAPTVLKLSKK